MFVHKHWRHRYGAAKWAVYSYGNCVKSIKGRDSAKVLLYAAYHRLCPIQYVGQLCETECNFLERQGDRGLRCSLLNSMWDWIRTAVGWFSFNPWVYARVLESGLWAGALCPGQLSLMDFVQTRKLQLWLWRFLLKAQITSKISKKRYIDK